MPKSKQKKPKKQFSYHLFCYTCKRGWHLMNKTDMWIIDQIHLDHVRYGSSKPIKCGKECANDWEMLQNADL